MDMPQPQDEHRWLHRLVGRWQGEGECVMGPDQPPMKNRMTETVRSLGGLWVIAEGEGEVPGESGTAHSVMTLGFDPARGRFAGSFIASVMTHFWVYDGALDAAKQVLTLDAQGPSFADPKVLVPYQDIIAFEGEDRRSLTSRVRSADGSWTHFMRAEYRRIG